MRIFNFVHEVSQVNFGMWNAAVATAQALAENHAAESFIVGPLLQEAPKSNSFTFIGLTDLSKTGLSQFIASQQLNPATDIIVSHGAWKYPSKWGAALKKQGFCWMVVPHGTVQRWSLNIKPWKKYPYLWLFEHPIYMTADVLRAVGPPEFAELSRIFKGHKKIVTIANSTTLPVWPIKKEKAPRKVVFMARIHPGKGVVELAQAWAASKLNGHPDFELLIAGPDHGALAPLLAAIETYKSSNLTYVGPQYGAAKQELLNKASFYVLPSKNETFPTSVVEALSYGLVPLISAACNFPEVLEQKIGFEIGLEPQDIVPALNQLALLSDIEWDALSKAGRMLIEQGYSDTQLAQQQFTLFSELLARR